MFSHTKRTFLGKAYHDHLGTRNLVKVETTHYNYLEGRDQRWTMTTCELGSALKGRKIISKFFYTA